MPVDIGLVSLGGGRVKLDARDLDLPAAAGANDVELAIRVLMALTRASPSRQAVELRSPARPNASAPPEVASAGYVARAVERQDRDAMITTRRPSVGQDHAARVVPDSAENRVT